MGGLNLSGLNIPTPWSGGNSYTPPPSRPMSRGYSGSGKYNTMAWNSSPLSRPDPYSNPRFQPRGTWYGGSFGGGGGYNGGPLTPTPSPTTRLPPSLPTSGHRPPPTNYFTNAHTSPVRPPVFGRPKTSPWDVTYQVSSR